MALGFLDQWRIRSQSWKDVRADGADAESSHLLLQHLISSNFDTSSEEYKSLVKSVIESVKKAGEAAWATKRITRHEQACRV